MQKTMIIENFKPRWGHHCITNSLKQIFEFNNYPLSESMLFGLGSGLSFVHVNLAKAPIISERIKPLELEKNISDRIGIKIQAKTPKNYTIRVIAKVLCLAKRSHFRHHHYLW